MAASRGAEIDPLAGAPAISDLGGLDGLNVHVKAVQP
jgi:hypothetical protein